MNMRTQQYKHRFAAYSNDEGETWTDFHADNALVDPGCQGTTLSISDTNSLAFCNNASLTRSNLTVQISNDGGNSWNEKLVIHKSFSAYSDLVQIDDNTIGCLYEFGENEHCYENIGFALIQIS